MTDDNSKDVLICLRYLVRLRRWTESSRLLGKETIFRAALPWRSTVCVNVGLGCTLAHVMACVCVCVCVGVLAICCHLAQMC